MNPRNSIPTTFVADARRTTSTSEPTTTPNTAGFANSRQMSAWPSTHRNVESTASRAGGPVIAELTPQGAGELGVGVVAEEDEPRFGDFGVCLSDGRYRDVGGGSQRPAVDAGRHRGERDSARAELV